MINAPHYAAHLLCIRRIAQAECCLGAVDPRLAVPYLRCVKLRQASMPVFVEITDAVAVIITCSFCKKYSHLIPL